MLTSFYIIKISIISLSFIAFIVYLFKKYRPKNKENSNLRHNILLLRNEKLLTNSDRKLEKKRQKLLNKIKVSDKENQKELIQRARKLGLPAGEILLAVKIQMSTK